MEEDERPDEVVARVPNTAASDALEVESLTAMWLDARSAGGALLQFYPDPDTAVRQLGYTEQAQLAVQFTASRVLDPGRGLVPTRLSTPLSVLEAAYPGGGLIGVYHRDDPARASAPTPARGARVLVPRAVLVVCAPQSPDYLKRLAGWDGGVSHALLAGTPRAVEDAATGRQPPAGERRLVADQSARSLVEIVRRASAHFLFPVVELGPSATVEDAARLLLSDSAWSIDDYGLYEHHA